MRFKLIIVMMFHKADIRNLILLSDKHSGGEIEDEPLNVRLLYMIPHNLAKVSYARPN